MTRREYIANFPTGVIAIRLTASEPGALSVNVTLDRSKGILGKYASTENNTVTLDVGGDGSDAVPFRAAVRAKLDGGKCCLFARSLLAYRALLTRAIIHRVH